LTLFSFCQLFFPPLRLPQNCISGSNESHPTHSFFFSPRFPSPLDPKERCKPQAGKVLFPKFFFPFFKGTFSVSVRCSIQWCRLERYCVLLLFPPFPRLIFLRSPEVVISFVTSFHCIPCDLFGVRRMWPLFHIATSLPVRIAFRQETFPTDGLFGATSLRRPSRGGSVFLPFRDFPLSSSSDCWHG